jgi:thioredoxin 1
MADFKALINSEIPVLVDFTAEWCAPCKMMHPILQELASKVGDKAKIIKVDVDKNPQAASHYNIQGVPTIIIFRKGEIKWRQSGVIPANELIQVLQPYIS